MPLPPGGALSRNTASKSELVKVPSPALGSDLGSLLTSGTGVDCTFVVEDEEMKVRLQCLHVLLRVSSSVMGYVT